MGPTTATILLHNDPFVSARLVLGSVWTWDQPAWAWRFAYPWPMNMRPIRQFFKTQFLFQLFLILLHQPWPSFYLPDFWSGSGQDMTWNQVLTSMWHGLAWSTLDKSIFDLVSCSWTLNWVVGTVSLVPYRHRGVPLILSGAGSHPFYPAHHIWVLIFTCLFKFQVFLSQYWKINSSVM